MIETLYGRLFEIDGDSGAVVIECGGVGYSVTVNRNTIASLPAPSFTPDGNAVAGEYVRVFTHMAVREDGVELYGFTSREELGMFRLLISVSGVGPKAAMSVLSVLSPASLARAVESGDSKTIATAPGVGPKGAARIVLELKDRIRKNFTFVPQAAEGAQSGAQSQLQADNAKIADARDALTALGYSRSEIAAAMKDIDLSADVEDIIRQALAALMKN